jgi:hypothetical protein
MIMREFMDASYHASGRHPVLSAVLALSCAMVVMQGLNSITLRQPRSVLHFYPIGGSFDLWDNIAAIPGRIPCAVAVPILPPNFERNTQMAGMKLRPNLWPAPCRGEMINRKDHSSIVGDCGPRPTPNPQHCRVDALFE